MTTSESIQLTPTAVQKTEGFLKSKPEHEGKALRVYVQGGGCSGFSYGFMFDAPREDDIAIDYPSVKVVIDPMSLQYLKGCTVDYTEDFTKSGFVIKNPNATGTCGCGESFSVN